MPDPVKISALPPADEAFVDHVVPAVRDGVTETLTLLQIIELLASGALSLAAVDIGAEQDVASATTVDLTTNLSFRYRVTGATTINAFTLGNNAWAILRFSATPTLTHNGTTLILPGAANIVAAIGDQAIIATDASGNVRMLAYFPASGQYVARINAAAKNPPIDADRVYFGNSVASFGEVYSTWAQVKAFFKTATDALYAPIGDYVDRTTAQSVAGAKTFSSIPILSGGGIKFPAVQVPSADVNVLDDYEEGTFVPTLVASGATFSYVSQYGKYTKIGDLCFCHIELELATSGNTLSANQISLGGFPFNVVNLKQCRFANLHWRNTTTSFIHLNLQPVLNTAAGTINGLTAAGQSNISTVTAAQLCHATNGTEIRAEFYYRLA